jgi:predicted lipoprotein with Yx(FWY)xxD motif
MISLYGRQKARITRRRAALVVPVAVAGLAALAACGSSSPSTSSSGSSSPATSSTGNAAAAAVGLKTANVNGTTILTNAKGFTLYTFAPDTSTKSKCNGACAAAWPPQKATGTVKSPYTAITRSDGSKQLAFHGHPLYTFTADTSPGQANGNGVNNFGGLWHEVPASGAAAPSGSATPSASGGGIGGY